MIEDQFTKLLENIAESGTAGVLTMDRAYIDLQDIRITPILFEVRALSGEAARWTQARVVRRWLHFLDKLQPDVPRGQCVLVWRTKPAYVDGNYHARLTYLDRRVPE